MSLSMVHATSVVINSQGVMIVGKSGFGKSMLALALMENGGFLIADDITFLENKNGALYASGDRHWKGCMEVRGMGIVQGVSSQSPSKIDFVVELVEDQTQRMPTDILTQTYCGVAVPTFKIYKDEKYLPELVKFAGKIVSKEVSLISFDSNIDK